MRPFHSVLWDTGSVQRFSTHHWVPLSVRFSHSWTLISDVSDTLISLSVEFMILFMIVFFRSPIWFFFFPKYTLSVLSVSYSVIIFPTHFISLHLLNLFILYPLFIQIAAVIISLIISFVVSLGCHSWYLVCYITGDIWLWAHFFWIIFRNA